jgi:hypothetical protein
MVAHRGEKLSDVVVVKAIAHPPTLAYRQHEPELPQHAQLLGYGALLHRDRRGKLLDGPLTLDQRVEQPHAALSGKRAHRLGDRGTLASPEGPAGRAVLERMGHWDNSISEQVIRYPLEPMSGRSMVRGISKCLQTDVF